MKSRLLRAATVGLTIVSTLATAAPSHAFFGLFQPRYTTAAPPTYPAYCGACPQTVQYVPQTCFRTQTTNVPVTTLRPVSVIDPCTGCLQTIMQPTTSVVQQVRFIPYQSFRIVQRPTVVAAPMATTVQFAPTCGVTQSCGVPALATTSFAATPLSATSGCSTCGVSAASFAAPTTGMPLSVSPIGSTMPQIPTAVAPSFSSGTTYSTPGSATTTYGAVPSVGPVTPTPSLSPVIIRSPTTLNGTTTITQSPATTTTPSTTTLSPTTPSTTPGTTVYGPITTTVPATSTPAATAPTTPAPAPAATEPQSPVTPAPSTKLVPIPDLRFTPEAKPTTGAQSPTTSTPGLVDPNSRTTMLPSAHPWSSTLVSWPTRRATAIEAATKVEPAATPTANDWRPSNR